MALPCGFVSPTEYFVEFFNFIQKYDCLFNFPNTHILVNHTLDKIEVDTSKIDISKEDFDIRNLNDVYIADFFRNLDNIHVKFDDFSNKGDLDISVEVPLSTKKKHEIACLANEIKKVCKNLICDTIIDFGSGLGYLDEQLFKTTYFNVLGLECNEAHYVAAKKRQRKYHNDSVQRVKYIKHTINQQSYLNIEEYMKDKFPNSNGFCIAGLHACADLTVDAINIFLKMENARAMAVMPCCYHRIIQENDSNSRFKNLPLSKALKEIYEDYSGFKYITIPFLRLAAQPPNIAVEKLDNLVFNLLSRAVLQLYACKYGHTLKRRKRKAVRLKALDNNFEAYATDAVNGFKLLRNESTEYKHETHNNGVEEKIDANELISIWRQVPQVTFKKAAIFVLLQNHLQPVFENFVLLDRLVFLQENGIKNCRFKRIVNENISPRCLGLIAEK